MLFELYHVFDGMCVGVGSFPRLSGFCQACTYQDSWFTSFVTLLSASHPAVGVGITYV